MSNNIDARTPPLLAPFAGLAAGSHLPRCGREEEATNHRSVLGVDRRAPRDGPDVAFRREEFFLPAEKRRRRGGGFRAVGRGGLLRPQTAAGLRLRADRARRAEADGGRYRGRKAARAAAENFLGRLSLVSGRTDAAPLGCRRSLAL